MNLYREESSNPKWNAQRNLEGRTHYVDDNTLRFHHSRVLSAKTADNGLLFALVESVALDIDNTARGYRGVIFDVFGNVLDRPDLADSYKSRKAATAALLDALEKINAKKHTLKAIQQRKKCQLAELSDFSDKVKKL